MGNVANTLFFLPDVQFVLLLVLYPVPILSGRINVLHDKSSLSEILMITYDTSGHFSLSRPCYRITSSWVSIFHIGIDIYISSHFRILFLTTFVRFTNLETQSYHL